MLIAFSRTSYFASGSSMLFIVSVIYISEQLSDKVALHCISKTFHLEFDDNFVSAKTITGYSQYALCNELSLHITDDARYLIHEINV